MSLFISPFKSLIYIVVSMEENTTDTIGTMGKAASIAVIIMAGSNFLSRLLGFVRMIVLAHVAGMGANVDAFSYSFLLPDIINHLLAGSALSITFIPIFQDIFTNKSEEEAWRFFSNLFTVGTIIFIIVIAVSMTFTDNLLIFAGENIRNPNDPAQYALTVKLTRIVIPAQLFFFWGALLNGVQYAKKRFLLPALTPLLYNVGIILGGLFLYPYIKIAGFSWGVLSGAFVGNVVVQLPGAIRVGMKFRPYINLKDRDLLHWFFITIPLILGLGMTFSNEILFRAFGSGSSDGTGAIASLDYSFKTMMFLVGFFGQSFAAGIFPFISQLAVEKKYTELNKFIKNVLIKIAAMTIPISLIMILLSDNVIAVLYQRGKFSAVDTIRTARNFMFYLPGTFFMAGGLVVLRAYYSMKNTILPLLITTASVLLCLPLYYFLEGKMGAEGIAAASSVFVFVSFFLLITLWKIVYKNTFIFSFLKSLLIIILFSSFGFGLCYFIKTIFSSYVIDISFTLLRNLLIIIVAGTPSIVLVVILLEIAGIINLRILITNLLSHSLLKK